MIGLSVGMPEEKVVPASYVIAKIKAGGPAEFDNYTIVGDLNLSALKIKGVVHFNHTNFKDAVNYKFATFSDAAYFWDSNFNKTADFSGATFSEYADFYRATFSGDAFFSYATFNGFADFYRAIFRGEASFSYAIFSSDVSFSGATFGGDASFSYATMDGDSSFWGATFNGGAYLLNAIFSRDAYFEKAQFNNDVEFGDARFENKTSFYRILLKRPAYFENGSMSSLNLTKADYSRLHLSWDSVKSLDFDEGAYLALIKNYNNLGWYNDANECYYDYRNAVRNNWLSASAPNLKTRVSNIFNYLVDSIEWLLYGYGVEPLYPIIWSAIFILAFGLFFKRKNCLRKLITKKIIEKPIENSKKVAVNVITLEEQVASIDPFFFSLLTFTSGFTSFFQPSVEYELEHYTRWAIFERLLGTVFIALLITAISKTYLIR